MLLSKTGVGAIRDAPLIALITSCCSAGFLLFGYDQGNARDLFRVNHLSRQLSRCNVRRGNFRLLAQ